ncbi:MAG: AAA-like domain-containing protein [Leptolyngbya sp. SIO1E4]|nr:AAA-like domain-containing protein [Leptolyngbya sp. SIO1E4]
MYEYCVGGSLAIDDPTYIERSADDTLYTSLLRGEVCYVLTSRQMGKSSLRLRTRHRLERAKQGRCASIDLTRIGSQQLSLEQWYQGLAFELQRKFGLPNPVHLPTWWHTLGTLSPVQKLSQFIETVLLTGQSEEPLFIFLDEIDSVKGLSFSVSDFFGLVRFCYNERAENPAYRRLTWALFGVATPHDLVANAQQAPFNIGTAIQLSGFSWTEAAPLAIGLSGCAQQPEQLLTEVLRWTGGQPFLTQKLCGLLRRECEHDRIATGAEASVVERVVRSHLIHHWEAQDEPEHLRTIRDRILADETRSGRLLSLHQRLLTHDSIKPDGSNDQADLKLSGIAIERNCELRVTNAIYAAVFNTDWVNQCLSRQRPYAAMLNAWVSSNYQDDSRLLMGQALQEAIHWAADKSLSDLDYRFLSASQEWDAKMVRMELEAQEKANRMLAKAQKKANQMIGLGYLSLTACLVISAIALLISFLR